MDFLKKHYEKILLGIVLLGLVGALLFLPLIINREKQSLTDMRTQVIASNPKPLDPLDLSVEGAAMARMQAPYKVDLETTNKLFNPVQWQRALDGHLIKVATGSEVGPKALDVVRITPLFFILRLESVTTNEFGARYAITVERQASTSASQRGKHSHYASIGDKNDAFTLKEIHGPPDNPTELILTLTDSGEIARLSKDQPFQRTDGYMADLKYDPEENHWQNQRVGGRLKFQGRDYIIVAIDSNEVIVSDQLNQKKTTRPYSP